MADNWQEVLKRTPATLPYPAGCFVRTVCFVGVVFHCRFDGMGTLLAEA
jgi:hypothetical protein